MMGRLAWNRALMRVAVAACGATSFGMGAGEAKASIVGKQGIEIEGPMDRRGFYIGAGAGGGVTFFGPQEAAGFGRVNLALGGGITKRFTLGLDAQFMPYFTNPFGLGAGADVEGTGFIYRGLFIRGALGALAMPRAADDNRIVAGLGGRIGLGYEFFLNATAAMGIGIDYDLRATPGYGGTQGAVFGLRFTWY